jgi:eukaryotic-like serine/threonine-protein kinase
LPCLDDSTLAEYVQGLLPPTVAVGVEQHVDACEDCRKLTSTLAKVMLDATARPAVAVAEGPPSGEVQLGDVIAEKYRLERALGAGGMGVVFAAKHLALNQTVALKFMQPSALGNMEAVARFLREARVVAQLKSEHVGRVLDLGTLANGAPYIVMEYLEGEDLERLLSRRGSLPLADVLDLVLQAMESIAEAHAAGIVHRDLKPANLFLTLQPGGKPMIKVLDFGVSKWSDPSVAGWSTITGVKAVMGSPAYMAPEQLISAATVDARADIWSLGCTLYQLLTGHLPFEGDTFPELTAKVLKEEPLPLKVRRSDISAPCDAVVRKCLAKRPEDRYQDLCALAAALGALGSPDLRPRVEQVASILGALPVSPPARRPLRWLLAAGAAVFFAAGVVYGVARVSARRGLDAPAAAIVTPRSPDSPTRSPAPAENIATTLSLVPASAAVLPPVPSAAPKRIQAKAKRHAAPPRPKTGDDNPLESRE